jgi:hypothetical protein
MELLKKAKSALNFQDRYSDMEGSEGGFSGKQRRALKRAEKSGLGLRKYQEDRKEYLDTVGDERIRAIGTGAAAVGGVVAGIYTGNPKLIGSSLSMGANYLGGEMAEDAAGNDGVNQQLSFKDAMTAASPFISMIGQGGGKDKENPIQNTPQYIPQFNDMFSNYMNDPTGGVYKQGGRLRYNPRKYDYIKGNTFGFK